MQESLEVDRLVEENRHFIEVAKVTGWTPESKQKPWDYIESRYRELMDLHDLVKAKALECRNCTKKKA